MKNYKEHVTKGQVAIDGGHIRAKDNVLIAYVGDGSDRTLIAEAFNVLHETGFTPRELVEHVKELQVALGAANDMLEEAADDVEEAGYSARSNNMMDAVRSNAATLTKYQPKPVKG